MKTCLWVWIMITQNGFCVIVCVFAAGKERGLKVTQVFPEDGVLLPPYLLDYTPPFLHCSLAKKKGGRLIEFCTYAPSLRPPPSPPNAT